MTGETILVVDDERNIVDLVVLYAKAAGYRCLPAHDGETAVAMALADKPALVVLDLMLPKIDGWEVCKRIRARSEVPIIMLTARDDAVDKIVGLELGADDYLTKPFYPRELMARIKAILRRTHEPTPATGHRIIETSGLRLDLARREATVNGQPTKLRAKEFDLAWFLLENRGLVFSREKLLQEVWGFDFAGETRTVDVHVAQLRKLFPNCGVEIETVFGVGYKLNQIQP